jgi:hypothetical protein
MKAGRRPQLTPSEAAAVHTAAADFATDPDEYCQHFDARERAAFSRGMDKLRAIAYASRRPRKKGAR